MFRKLLRVVLKTLIPAMLVIPAMAVAADKYDALKSEVEALRKEVRQATEWKRSESVVHLAGYGAVSYADREREDGSFSQVQFSPIFHYLYKDLMMLESELEIEEAENGETETELEYLTLDLFLNDYMVLVAGKFLSPIGQFRQNLHPTWINKQPSAPPGFGHDGAAPLAEVGLELRGGFPLGQEARGNYAVYVGNGPELESDDGEVHGIETDGFTRDAEGEKVIGGRVGVLPIPKLEIGVSAATGKAAVTMDEVLGAITGDPERDYRVVGADVAYQIGNLDLRGEYVRQDVAASAASIAPMGGDWQVWYTQAAYQFRPSKWEGVLRYTDFDSPHDSQDIRQSAVGVNYLFASNVIAKLAYESNDGQAGTNNDQERVLLQLAYGF